jgi:hypothetical protein
VLISQNQAHLIPLNGKTAYCRWKFELDFQRPFQTGAYETFPLGQQSAAAWRNSAARTGSNR